MSTFYQLDRRQGSFTALICFDSMIDEQSPFGDPNKGIDVR